MRYTIKNLLDTVKQVQDAHDRLVPLANAWLVRQRWQALRDKSTKANNALETTEPIEDKERKRLVKARDRAVAAEGKLALAMLAADREAAKSMRKWPKEIE